MQDIDELVLELKLNTQAVTALANSVAALSSAVAQLVDDGQDEDAELSGATYLDGSPR